MSVDIMKCIRNPFENKHLWVYLLMISILCYTPVLIIFLSIYFKHYTIVKAASLSFPLLMFLLFIPQGFIMRFVHKELNNKGYENLTLKQDLLESFKTGLRLFLITFLYFILMMVILGTFIGYYFIDDYFTALDLLSSSFFFQSEVMNVILVCIGIFLIFSFVLIPYCLVAYAENFKFSEAFNWKKIFTKLYKSWKNFLISILGILLINLFIILVICASFWITQVWNNAILSPIYSNHISISNIPLSKALIILIFTPGTIIVPIVIVSFISNMIEYQLISQVYKIST